jgi:hypothetical protein
MQTIKINLKSIKPNPNVGNVISYIPQSFTMAFECNTLPDFLIEGKDVIIEEWCNNPEKYIGRFIGQVSSELIEKLKTWGNNVRTFKMSASRNILAIPHLPEPSYFYNYLNTKVKCETCGKAFMSDKFLYADNMDNDEERNCGFSDKVCPYCGKWNCCDIEYESIENALNRKQQNKIKKTQNYA